MRLEAFAQTLAAGQGQMTNLLRRFVELESGSYDKRAVDRVGDVLTSMFASLGFVIDRLPQQETGDHRVARRPGSGKGKLLVLIHLDTVWPTGTLAENPFRIDNGQAFGPGVLDMKGGWVVLLSALRGLGKMGWDAFQTITVFMTADEQLGSPTARSAIEELAAVADWALVMEPARESGALVTGRGAVGAVFVDVEGLTAHAMGGNPGASAIIEASHIAVALERLTARESGLIVNVGTISGGSARQVVPDRVRMSIDLRAPTPSKADWLIAQVHQIVDRPTVPGTRSALSGGITRPAYPIDQVSTELFDVALRCGKALGIEIRSESTRGGSDGNFTAACGIPTLDGLGPEGAYGCTRDEYVALESIPRRAALLAGLMTEVSGTQVFDLD
jgi:glutamate carboxypeptidase